MANEQNLTSWKPGQSGNPKGKPKGALSLSTHIKNLLNDEEFEANILDPKIGVRGYKGIPIKAIIQVAIARAVNGDDKSREWLARYGYGTSVDDSPEEINIKFEIVNKVPEPKKK